MCPDRCFARISSSSNQCPSDQYVTRWAYLSEVRQCVMVRECPLKKSKRGTIRPTGNNFATRSHCEVTCMPKSMEEVCRLPRDPGPCHHSQPRFFYNPRLGSCQPFLYGGCLGNLNRFLTRPECRSACGGLRLSNGLTELQAVGFNSTEHQDSTEIMEERINATLSGISLPKELLVRMKRLAQQHSERFCK
ncbi:unnamed protein product [Protopolystoma xenopodis]|uniref:BPTI/Kunitz inhibitor domain-containing protein n=1 Tax=Protopolystoma xenopodis TaxID=117903 RepID=A0A448WMQ0_9PLAT|nr:unnamed protein product [Protopolystoma xenopodis]